MIEAEWSAQRFARSVTSRCFTYGGKDPWLRADEEVRQIVDMEESLGSIPAWAQEIVDRAMRYAPWWCPHYLFPQPFLDIVEAIGSETPPGFLHGCYTVARDRKERMADYVFCLDAWLGGATCHDAANELLFRKRPGPNWQGVCQDLWGVMGDHSELKDLLVERLLHRQRWWLKANTWDDDARDRFCCDQYLGDIRGRGDPYGNPCFCDPYFTEMETPRVKRLAARIAELSPEWAGRLKAIEHSHLCAPKAFRFFERMIWAIGKDCSIGEPCRPRGPYEAIPGFLRCEDTYGDPKAIREYAGEFPTVLRDPQGVDPASQGAASDVRKRLGTLTPTKMWLCRLLACKLERHAATFSRQVTERPTGKGGTRSLEGRNRKGESGEQSGGGDAEDRAPHP